MQSFYLSDSLERCNLSRKGLALFCINSDTARALNKLGKVTKLETEIVVILR